MKRYFYVIFVLALAAAAAAGALAADPGSKDDPLATTSYVQHYAQYERLQLPAGKALSVAPSGEFILVTPEAQLVNLRGFDADKDVLINLSTGKRVAAGAVEAYQLYLNAGEEAFALTPDFAVTLLVRGEHQ